MEPCATPGLPHQKPESNASMAALEHDLEAKVLAALARADAAEAAGAAAVSRAAQLETRLAAATHAGQRLLRLRFRRAPPTALSVHRTAPVRWEIDVTDDQGSTAEMVEGLDVTCRIEGAPHDVATTRSGDRWVCAAPVEAFIDRCSIVAEPFIKGKPCGPLDVLSVAAEVRFVTGSGDDAPTFEAIRDLRFGDVSLRIVEEFGDACGSHLWNAGLVLAAYLATLDEAMLPALGERGFFLEVGAGVGATSLALAARGLSGDATDHGRVLPLLERNIARNGFEDTVRVVPWDVARDEIPRWNAAVGLPRVLIMADVLYAEEAARALPELIAALPDLREIWLAHTNRGAGDRLDTTVEVLASMFPAVEVVERVRDTRVVVLRKHP